jgi:cob(I)alamin adenosyltransferase
MVQRIYTKTGDEGDTGLFGGGRVRKSHPRVEAYGAVDELNAVLGWALTAVEEPRIRVWLLALQSDLFALGAHLATHTSEGRPRPQLPALPDSRIAQMESWIDEADDELPELRSFILPGGTPGGAALHVARTVCRRTERRVIELSADEDVAPSIVVFLNRLSDLLFMLARLENSRAGGTEQPWLP